MNVNRKKIGWICFWLFSSIGVFGICVLLKSYDLGGAFFLAGLILAIVAQVLFGSSTWATTGETVVIGRGGHFARISPTLMEGFHDERFKESEREAEWGIGLGLTVGGLLMCLFGILAFIYVRQMLGINIGL
ncbi:MAG: hypothetical protein ACPL1Y_06875 [Thermoplasmata archaeon]